MSNTSSTQTLAPARDPLQVGMLVAERFMRIDPPRETYMYHLGIWGLTDLYQATGEQRLLDFAYAFWERRTSGKPAFNWHLYLATGDDRWLAGVEEAGEQWLANPRRDRDGALLDPRGRYTIDIVSGLVSVPIFFGHCLRDARFFDEAYRQLEINRGYLEDPETGLWYNRWGHGLHPHRPNPGLWGRGNGWLVNAWGRTMHLWDPAHPRRAEALAIWQHYCRSNAAFQTGAGMFRQIMNRPHSFEETTATALIGSGIAHGVVHDTLPAEMGAVALRAAAGLDGIVDAGGNIHNASTTAGGYNFERQYESCGIFNDPHGDGSVMGCCAIVHRMLEQGKAFDRARPAERPVIVTDDIADCVSFDQGHANNPDALAAPVLARVQALEALPALDRQGGVILGLLHWHAQRGDEAALAKARTLFDASRDDLEDVARWRLAGELARAGGDTLPGEVSAFVRDYRARVARDREGLVLDACGGYDIARLFHLLPLLGMAGGAGDAACFDDACAQVLGYQEWLMEPNCGLWHSAYGRGAHPQRVTPGFWALGNAYALAGVVDLLEYLPLSHGRYIDVVCLLRDLVKPLHEWLPAIYGWTQLLDDLHTFHDVAANALLTYGFGRAVLRGWIKPAYYAAAWGGLYHLSRLIDAGGHYRFASLPEGGLDTRAAYQAHRVENDPSALGFVLSGCALAASCRDTGINYGVEDDRLGAR